MREVFKKIYNRKIVVAAGILIVIAVGFFLYRHSNERSNEDYINVFIENQQDFECVAKVMGKWASGSIDFDDGISSANQEIEKESSGNADFNNSLTNLYDLKEISCILIEDDEITFYFSYIFVVFKFFQTNGTKYIFGRAESLH